MCSISVSPSSPERKLVEMVEFWAQLQSSWLWSILMGVVSVPLWKRISLILRVSDGGIEVNCAVLGLSYSSQKQSVSQAGPGDPLAGVFALVNKISLMIGWMLPSSIHNLLGIPKSWFNEVIINQKKNMKASFFPVKF